MTIEFKRLAEISLKDIVALMTEPRLRAHMPLLSKDFDIESARMMVVDKEKSWDVHGYGVWAFFADDRFVGWGGLQWENGEPDLGLVLNPDAWGLGRAIYEDVARRAFDEFGFDYVTVLLPPSRTRLAALRHLGFARDGDVVASGKSFKRFVLTQARYRTRES